jgi:hypothetical protein
VRTVAAIVIALCFAANAFAQGAAAPPERTWSIGVTVNTYFLPEQSNFGQPVITADRERLHLETRYNYEDLNTGSVWAGVNFSGGKTVEWEITPMVGGVIGDTDGVAPGYRGSVTWRRLEFYSEGEYVFDAHDSADSYFYNWSELSWAPVEWFRFGLVTQRTRVYRHPAHARLSDRPRHSARPSRWGLVQAAQRHALRLQSGRQQAGVRAGGGIHLLTG